MRQIFKLLILMAVAALTTGCAGCADVKDGTAGDAGLADFEQTMRVADSLYSSMQFRDAYDLYVQLLDSKEAKADSVKRLRVLSSLSKASELSGHKDMGNKWLHQQLDLAEATGNDYYHAMAQVSMGQNIFFEGNRERGIQYVNEAISLMAKSDRDDADHLTHGFLNLLASLYSEMKDYDSALHTNERNLQLTTEGTRWGAAQNQQLIDRRMALAKTAGLLARMGIHSSGSQQSAYFQRADSAYAAWKAVQYEGNHTRDYFIVDYMKRRGLHREAVAIYNDLIERIRLQGDTLGEMMNTAKWGLADVYLRLWPRRHHGAFPVVEGARGSRLLQGQQVCQAHRLFAGGPPGVFYAAHVYPSRYEHLADSPRLRFQQLRLLRQVLPLPFRHDAHRVPSVGGAESVNSWVINGNYM